MDVFLWKNLKNNMASSWEIWEHIKSATGPRCVVYGLNPCSILQCHQQPSPSVSVQCPSHLWSGITMFPSLSKSRLNKVTASLHHTGCWFLWFMWCWKKKQIKSFRKPSHMFRPYSFFLICQPSVLHFALLTQRNQAVHQTIIIYAYVRPDSVLWPLYIRLHHMHK